MEEMKNKQDEELSLEEAFSKLDVLAQKLEDRETSLEDSFLLYQQGMELLKLCNGRKYSPAVGRSRHPRMFMSVLLPEPDAPIRATYSPFSIFSVMPLRTGTSISPRK